jgi:tetratricopeptide (TPR) repeat protein
MKFDRHTYRIWLTPLIIVLALVVSGCGGKGQVSTLPEEPRVVDETISPTGYNHFVNANLLELFGVYQEAGREYEKALKYFPESATIRTDYARLLFRMSRVDDALAQALQIVPKSSDIFLLIGDCYRLLDNMDPAVKYYREAIALDPDNVNAYWHLAGYFRRTEQADSAIAAYYQLARLLETDRIWFELGTWLSAGDRYDEAEKAFLKAIELNPDEDAKARTWLELGVLRGKDERYSDALEAFQNSIDIDSSKENLSAYIGLATTYDAMDILPRAEQVYEKALSLSPNDVRIYRQMLAMYLNRQDIKKSIEVSFELVSLVPSDWVAQRRLGILLYSDEQLDRADSLFSDRIDFGDDNVLNYFYRGRVALDQERLADAKPLFRQSIAQDPSFIDGWLNLGFIYARQDSLGLSIDVYRDGLGNVKLYEDSIRLNFALGTAYERNDQFYEAVNTFKGLIEKERDHAPALNYLGYMLADRGEELLYALELIERAIELSPDNGAYIDSYAWVQYKLGNYEVALTELKKAVALLDDDAVIYEHLGDVYKAMGDMTEAERHYRRALEIDPESIVIEEKLKE